MEFRKSHSRKTNTFILVLFILSGVVGIFSVLFAFYLGHQRLVLSFTGDLPSSPASDMNQYFDPVKITFTNPKLSLPVASTTINNGIWEISGNSASYLSSSAKPGQAGNIVIYGHNKRKIFGPLIGRIKKGDVIELTTENDTKYKYKVTKVFEVPPTDIEVVYPTDFEVLTVYTCTGLLDSKRLIIKAYPSQ